MTVREDLPARGHAPELIRALETAILNVAARPPGLRGRWLIDDDWLQSAAKAVRARREALKSLTKDQP